MSQYPDCIFCKIAAGQISATIVHQEASFLAFLDVGPLAEGHLLVIPKDHYMRIVDMPAETCAALASAFPRLGRALLEVTGAEGFNLLQNNGQVAGQVVQHVHFHLIPRVRGDGLGYRWNAGGYPTGRDIEIAGAYKTALAKTAE